MKLILTCAFLVLAGAGIFIGTRLNNLALEGAKGSTRKTVRVLFFRYVAFFTFFLQFWLLTRMFPIYLILLLIGASMLGSTLYILLGAISGFTLEQNKKKIAVLTLIGGATRNPAVACLWLASSLLLQVSSIVLSLWVFWRYPIGDPKARVLIALSLFALPQIARIPMLLVLSWPVVTSEYLDNDLRNSHLAEAFSSIIYQTIFLLFPLWLFKEEIAGFNWRLPPFWILLSVPLFAFMIGALFPFFVGLYRYRSQSRAMLDWQANWLKETLVINVLPEGEKREEAFKERLDSLDEEITTRFAQNELFNFYQKLFKGEAQEDSDNALPVVIEQSPNASGQEQALVPVNNSAALVPKKPDIRKAITLAKQYIKGKQPVQNQMETGITEQVLSIMRANQAHLIDWDIRFAHLHRLLQLYEVSVDAKAEDTAKFAEARLENIKDSLKANTKKNVLAGAILSASSTLIIFLFQHYEGQLTALMDRLVH